MKKTIFITSLMLMTSIVLAKESTVFVADFSLNFIDGEKVLKSGNSKDRLEMIQLISDNTELTKNNYQYALRAALVGTAELQNDKNLNRGLELLDNKTQTRIRSFQVNVVRVENDARCLIELSNYANINTNRYTSLNVDCYGINGSAIAAAIQSDVDKSRLLMAKSTQSLEEAFSKLDRAVNIP